MQNTENGTYITIKRKKFGKCGPCPVFASCTLAFALQLKKKQGKTSVSEHGKTSAKKYLYYRHQQFKFFVNIGLLMAF
jgi:hypothetical protein